MSKRKHTVDVKFFGQPVKGFSPSIHKRILLSKHATKFPKDEETWTCRIIHDNKKDDPRRGILYVMPITQKTLQESFTVLRRRISTGELVVVVSYCKFFGIDFEDFELRSESELSDYGIDTIASEDFGLRSESEISDTWPKNIQDEIREALKRNEAEANNKSPQLILNSVQPQLKAAATAANLKQTQKLERKSLVANLHRGEDGKIRFQWAGAWLTDGHFWFPKVRPEGLEWKRMPIDAIPKGYWETFLNGLEGKLITDLLDYHSKGSWRQPAKPRLSLTARQKQIEETIKRQIESEFAKEMWHGNGVDAVAIGKCVVFFVPRPGRSDLYIVDNPGPGAIYRFDQKESAYQLARGEVTRTDLIKSGAQRILHVPGWEQELAKVIAAA